jgi:hypothetical protein
VLCATTAAWFWLELPKLRRIVRPIYVARGIISVPAVDPAPVPEVGVTQP